MPENPSPDPLVGPDIDHVAEELAGQEMLYNEFLADLDGVSSQALDYVAGQVDGQVSSLDADNNNALADLENKVYDPVCDLSGKCIDAEDFVKSQSVTPVPQSLVTTGTGPFGFPLVTVPGSYPCSTVQFDPSRIYNNTASVYHRDKPYTTSLLEPFQNYWCQSYWPSAPIRPVAERGPNEGWYLFARLSTYKQLVAGGMDKSFWPTALCWVYVADLKNEFTDFAGNVGFNFPPDSEGFSLFSNSKFSEMVPIESLPNLQGVAPKSSVCGCYGGTENTPDSPPVAPSPDNPPGTTLPTETPPRPTSPPETEPSPQPVTTPCPTGGVVTMKCPECKCNIHIDPIEIKPIYQTGTVPQPLPPGVTADVEPIPVDWSNWQYIMGRSRHLPWMREALALLPAQVRTAIENGRPETIAHIMFLQGLSAVADDEPLITEAQARSL